MQQAYSSGSATVLLSTNTAGRFFKAFGSRRALLSWDANAKTVTIAAASDDNTPGETIITTPASLVERALFHEGAYILRIQGQFYYMTALHYRNQGALANDLINNETSNFASVLVDAKKPVADLAALLKETMPKGMAHSDRITSKTHIKIVVSIAVLCAAIVIGTIIAGAMRA